MHKKLNSNVIPVLLCGGSGSRLWPMSRTSYPKQFLKCYPNSKYSFLQESHNRIMGINDFKEPIIICNDEHRFIAAQQMQELGVKPSSIILEPCGRNTGPAVAIACLKALEIEEDPVLLILPADHFIEKISEFRKVVKAGIDYALSGDIVTFGIKPTSAETGYGYIESEIQLFFDSCKASRIKRFIEKPDRAKAEQLIMDKKFSWNSGIFMMKAKVAINEFNKLNPEMLSLCKESLDISINDFDFQRINKNYFEKCQNTSFDKAIMENTQLGVVLPLDASWSDLGDWESLWKIAEKDRNGNVTSGKVLLEKVKNSYLKSESRLIVGMDIENLVVVETPDAIMIANKESSQKVKNIVMKLIKNDFKEATLHRKVFRPWGEYVSIAEGAGWQVKIITVNPESSLSLQMHKFRAEHWIIVSGKALVEIDEDKKLLTNNESTFIPLGSKHRLSNPASTIPLILIEVQSGSYLGEDDIYRFEDNYGRGKLFKNI